MTEWVDRTSRIAIGDRVAYSAGWLRSTGQLTGDAPLARGTVTGMDAMGQTRLAVVEWDTPDLPSRVNVANLSRVAKGGAVLDRD